MKQAVAIHIISPKHIFRHSTQAHLHGVLASQWF